MLSPEQLATIPIMPAPPGQTTNFKDHPSLTPSVLIITGITVPLIFIFLGLRIYIRARINRDFTIDDHLCILSALLSIAFTGLTLSMLDTPGNGPAGPHTWDVPLIRITPNYLKASLATAMLFAIASITVKTSILIFILRLFSRFRAARIMSWIGIVAVIIFYVSYVIPSLVLCVPNMSTTASCSKFEAAMSNAHGIFSTVSDLYILFIPVYMIGNLQLSPRSKYSLAGVFLTGLGACIASLIGSIYRFKFASSDDLTWASVPVYATVILELNLGIICACMPIVFVLFKRGTRTVRDHCSAGFHTLTGKVLGKSDVENHILANRDLPNRPRPAVIGVRTVVHQVHYQNAPEGSRWVNTYDSLESLDNDQHACQMNDLRQYDVTITAG